MKFCTECAVEIDTKDGENKCGQCERNEKRKADARANRREVSDMMKSLGLKKVRGSMGGVYWE